MSRSLRFATDAEVASLAAQGDQDAFGELYDRFGAQLFDFCARLTGSSDDAADVTHEVFVRASSRLSQLREPERVRAWLFSVARHECYAFTRRRSKTRPSDPMRIGETLEHTGRSAASTLESAELVTLVNDARSGLEADDLAVLDLKFRLDLSGNDLAEAAGVPHDQLHKVMARATERFEKALGAVVLIRHGRKDCATLASVVGPQATLTPLLRKQVSRHVESCDECTRRRKALVNPSTMSASAATKAASTFVAPTGLRDTILSSVGNGGASSSSSYGWQRNGFPRITRPRRTLPTLAMVGGLLALSAFVVREGRGEPFQRSTPPTTTTVPLVFEAGPKVPVSTVPLTTTAPPTSTTVAATTTTITTTTTTTTTTVAPTTTAVVVRTTVAQVPVTTRPVPVITTKKPRRRPTTIAPTTQPAVIAPVVTEAPVVTVAPEPVTQPPATPAPIITPDPVITVTQPPVVSVTTVPPTTPPTVTSTTLKPCTAVVAACPNGPAATSTTTTTRLLIVFRTIPPILVIATTTTPRVK